jgi:hypothetical protein
LFLLHVHAPTDDKIDYAKENIYKELQHVCDKFHKYHMTILLGDFNAKAHRENIFNRQLGMKAYMKLEMIMEL